MSEYDEFLEDTAGDSSVEPLSEEEQEALAAGGPESLDAHLEEKVVELPPLMTARDLMPEEPLDAIPSEPPDADTPPDSAAPTFIVVKNAYGPGQPSVKLASGEPVGVWLDRVHHNMSGKDVQILLARMGLDEVFPGRSEWFGKHRDKALKARAQIAADPRVAAFAEEEDRRKVEKMRVQAAFVDAQKKKEKKS